MRIIAALLVFAFHAGFQYPFPDKGLTQGFQRVFGLGGAAGVGFFFILSGFVLTWSARSSDTTTRFWRRRLVKVFPNHLVTFAAAALLLLNAGSALGGWKAVPSFFLLQAWFPQVDVASAMNPVAWSLSAELLFYLSFPFLLRGINRIRPQRLLLWAGGTVTLIFCVPMIAWTFPEGPDIIFGPVSQWEGWLVYMSPPARMLEFTFGMLLAELVMHGLWLRIGLLPATGIAVVAYWLAWSASWTYAHVAVMVLPLGLVIAAGAQADVTGRRSVLRSRPMVWLGNVSFAFYLWHALVLGEVSRQTGALRQSYGVAGGFAYLAIAFAVTLLLAWALYTLVEEPVMRRFGSARTRPPVVGPPVVPLPAPDAPAPAPVPAAVG
ncbi:acyltransferase family protein [Streptomyces sp. NPDC006879]|uniref:acyltransferase family protein n=1 Tax=Streptomyces sp. NPDC006879 TaxID=3364767 RepID=UPI0036CFC8FD